jgi:hypothetical protein
MCEQVGRKVASFLPQKICETEKRVKIRETVTVTHRDQSSFTGVIWISHQDVVKRPESTGLKCGEEYRNTCPAYGIFQFGLKQHKIGYQRESIVLFLRRGSFFP